VIRLLDALAAMACLDSSSLQLLLPEIFKAGMSLQVIGLQSNYLFL
jgi:hypothetical protein